MSEVIEKPKRKVYMVLAAMVLAFASIFATSTPAQAADARWIHHACGNVYPYKAKLYVSPTQYTKMIIHFYKSDWTYLGSQVRYTSGSVLTNYQNVRFAASIPGAGSFKTIYGYC